MEMNALLNHLDVGQTEIGINVLIKEFEILWDKALNSDDGSKQKCGPSPLLPPLSLTQLMFLFGMFFKQEQHNESIKNEAQMNVLKDVFCNTNQTLEQFLNKHTDFLMNDDHVTAWINLFQCQRTNVRSIAEVGYQTDRSFQLFSNRKTSIIFFNALFLPYLQYVQQISRSNQHVRAAAAAAITEAETQSRTGATNRLIDGFGNINAGAALGCEESKKLEALCTFLSATPTSSADDSKRFCTFNERAYNEFYLNPLALPCDKSKVSTAIDTQILTTMFTLNAVTYKTDKHASTHEYIRVRVNS